MKQIKFNKTEKNDKLTVNVKLPRRMYDSEPVINFSNSELIEYLNNEGIDLATYELSEQSQASLTSYADKANEPNLNGTWVFTKKVQKTQKRVNKKKTQAYNKGEDKTGG